MDAYPTRGRVAPRPPQRNGEDLRSVLTTPVGLRLIAPLKFRTPKVSVPFIQTEHRQTPTEFADCLKLGFNAYKGEFSCLAR